ncbi:hypothetical protein FB567DRAFT_619473 [Paraphoma chrysanthemicola]|uniref:Uncharacterized protein n=1 Tax=Paraphoma chrysanthemicola TaxID=798071 RepID=A0A8K0RAC6_9PLEO|nr:hypothetical protein FB567DRAFT_619473 [Paraphoma chrysanthemicola]
MPYTMFASSPPPIRRIPSRSTSNSSSSSSTPSIRPSMPPRKSKEAPSRNLSDFLASAPIRPLAPIFPPDHILTPADQTLIAINTQRALFTAKIPPGGTDDPSCPVYATDRIAVLEIYANALRAIDRKEPDLKPHHAQIALEADRKIKVVLGVLSADPTDTVFMGPGQGQFLVPIDPEYANPRIVDNSNRAQYRLDAWRRDGWPKAYPANAIATEKRPGERMVGAKSTLLSEKKMLKRYVAWSNDDLGGVVEVEGNVVADLPVKEPAGAKEVWNSKRKGKGRKGRRSESEDEEGDLKWSSEMEDDGDGDGDEDENKEGGGEMTVEVVRRDGAGGDDDGDIEMEW